MQQTTELDGTPVAYTLLGQGEPVVLLHGYLEDSRIWQPLAQQAASRYQMVLPDLPGHGKSSVQAQQSIESMAQSVYQVLQHAGLGPVHLVGHSMGGYVALAFLERWPELLQSVCLFHSHPFADSPAALEKRTREIEIVQQGHKNLLSSNIVTGFAPHNQLALANTIEQLQTMAQQQPAEGIVACLRAMRQRPDRHNIWAQSTTRRLLVWGRHDTYIPQATYERIGRGSNEAHLILESSGHQGFIEEPEHSYAALLRWWQQDL